MDLMGLIVVSLNSEDQLGLEFNFQRCIYFSLTNKTIDNQNET